MAASSGDKNERNFLQLHRLVLHSTGVLRAKFDFFVPSGTNLHAWLPSDIDLKKAYLTDTQINRIRKQTTSEKCDITVLTSLLRSTCYNPDHRLWNVTNNNNIDPRKIRNQITRDIADIVRIRNIRNEVCMKHLMSEIHCIRKGLRILAKVAMQYVSRYKPRNYDINRNMM